ncbi:MAG: hypothetical protein EHM58_12385 [Ignavibacteriae bacterium]|nr:MAG: hypothetical protein EHM58_12385 [Ignavibacteriota bacterium]
MNDVQKSLERADKTINKGFMGWITRLFMGKKFVDQANQGLNMAKQYSVNAPAQRQQLMMTGMNAKATVVKVEDTGALINYNPVVRLHMKVQPDFGMGFDVVSEQMVSKIAIPRAGDVLNIKYNAAKNDELIII